VLLTPAAADAAAATAAASPAAQVALSGLLFASAHPADAFAAEALLGTIFSLSLVAADGNLLVPLLAHALYNAAVLGTRLLL
jgi:membrane protease YdiL (CAAX protease family)